jgi:DNA-binding response OmpR family regulator
LNGLQVCEKARKIGINTPIIMLTARDTLEDKLAGFSGGADDYLVKPFAMEELVARIHALSERRQRSDIIQIGDLCVYANEKKVQRNGTMLKLSPDEWRLMLLLARKSPDVVKKERIEDEVWPQGMPSPDAFKMLVYRLRKNLDSEKSQSLLHTVRGVGLSLRVN